MKKNFESLKSYIASFSTPPQVITLAETWLRESEHIYYSIPGYNLISLPRPNRVGGGVGLYISKNFKYSIKFDLMEIMKDVCEYIVVEISLDLNDSIIVVSLYRPPNTDLQNFNVKFSTFLDKLTIGKKEENF